MISQNVNKDINIEVTNKCNLSCEGCFNKLNYGERIDTFEKLRNSFENSIEYLKYEYQKNKIMSISISISGGEPLLFVERISELSKICKMNLPKEIYTFRILTNGTLFTDQNISLLCSLDNIEFYISVDNYRYMFISNEKNAHANFKKLKENILLIYKYTKKKIILRINVNLQEINSLKKIIENISKSECKNIVILSFSRWYDTYKKMEYGELLPEVIKELYIESINNGICCLWNWKSNVDKYLACRIDGDCGYTIHSDGNFTLCPYSELNKTDSQLTKCMECTFLPICFGGCYLKNNTISSCLDYNMLAKSIEIHTYAKKVGAI